MVRLGIGVNIGTSHMEPNTIRIQQPYHKQHHPYLPHPSQTWLNMNFSFVGRSCSWLNDFLSDSAKTEISKKVMDILRAYHISNWYSEPYHQNQNPAEWDWCTCKLLVVLYDICMLHFKSYCMWCIEWINPTTGFIWNHP